MADRIIGIADIGGAEDSRPIGVGSLPVDVSIDSVLAAETFHSDLAGAAVAYDAGCPRKPVNTGGICLAHYADCGGAHARHDSRRGIGAQADDPGVESSPREGPRPKIPRDRRIRPGNDVPRDSNDAWPLVAAFADHPSAIV